MSSEPDLMTTREVAELMRRPQETLRFWRFIGQGPRSFKLGRAVVYERADVFTWIAEQKAATERGGDAA
ncbi:MAG TPA: helix-turn-helix domain-containing protein [Jatrophihabitans sp.]|nr:helix-turn-helix domain-containing protein [Jatrophihabitans sp.]